MNEKDIHTGSPMINQALFASMAYFCSAVWEIDLSAARIKVIHDTVMPQYVGAVWTYKEALDSLMKVCHPEDVGTVLSLFSEEFFKNLKTTYVAEARGCYENDQVRTFRCSITPLLDENGNTIVLYASFAEIQTTVDTNSGTERIADVIRERDESKKELERYRISDMYKQTIDNLEGSNIGLWTLLYRDGKAFMYGNQMMCELLGVPEDINPQEMFIKLFEGVDPAYLQEVKDCAKDNLAGIRQEVIYPFHHPTRGEIIIRCGGLLDRNFKGKGKLIRGYHQDVSDYARDILEDTHLGRSIAGLFANVYEVDLVNDTFAQIRSSAELQEEIGMHGRAYDLLNKVISLLDGENYEEKVLAFYEDSTLTQRLEDADYISIEVPIKTIGWTRQTIIPIDKNLSGEVTKILVVVQSIQKEKAFELERTAEIELQAAQARENLDIVNDIMDSAFWYIGFDEQGQISDVFWSQRLRNMLGYTDEVDFPNKLESLINAIHTDDRDKVVERFWETLASGKVGEHKLRINKKNGEGAIYKVSGRLANYSHGGPRLLAGTMINITQQENETRDMNNRLEVFVDGIKGGLKICSFEEGFPYVYVSKNVSAIQGYTTKEFLKIFSRGAADNCHKDDARNVEGYAYEQFHKTGAYEVKYRVQHKDGHWLWVYDYGKLVTDAKGNQFIYSVVQDIDEHENAALRLAAEKVKYEEALTKNCIYNCSLDLDKGIIENGVRTNNGTDLLARIGLQSPANYDEVNRRMLEHYSARILTPNGERLFSRAGLVKNFLEGKTTESVEYYLPHHDLYLRHIALIFEDPATGHLMANVFAHDITREKKEELAQAIALRDALYQAENANRSKTTFLNSMSHDIRTPLNAIIGFTKLASTHLDEQDRLRDYLSKIETSSDHLLALINDVLDMSRIESGKVRIEDSENYLPEILDGIYDIVQNDAKKKDLHLDFDISSVHVGWVYCDKLRLSQVLLNCIGNSIKYTMPGGRVSLKVESLPRSLKGFVSYRFIVGDTGIGMSTEFLEHIFEPFAREETTTVSGIQGTGLGLAITKNIVDMMGGQISALSEKGVGTEIIMDFNFKIADIPEDQQYASSLIKDEDSFKDLTGVSILLVEDNELNREIAEVLLSELGAKVRSVEDGSVAVNELRKPNAPKYDVIPMDIQMPIRDGYQATKLIRKLDDPEVNSIPIIAMTANAFEEDRKLAFEAGMNEHLGKPIVIENVLRIINKVLKR